VGSENVSTLATRRAFDQEISPHSRSDQITENLSTYTGLRDQEIFPLIVGTSFFNLVFESLNDVLDQEKSPHIIK
jgi:hypothetical protein